MNAAPRSATYALDLAFRPPYDWAAMLAFLRPRAVGAVERIDGDTYHRTIELDGAHGSISVGPPTGAVLPVCVRFPHRGALPAIVARLRRQFDLDADPSAIAARLGRDRRLARLLAARPGLRLPGAWDSFELVVRAMLNQQITVVAAIGLAGRLVQLAGEPVVVPHGTPAGLTHVFPSAPRIAAAGAGLGTLGMPRARADALARAAAAVVADPGLLERQETLDAALARLRALPGIGDWTAQYIAMRALREPDAFPAGDVGLQRALARAGTRPSAAELLARAERWRPWRAYAAQHLWASLAG